MKSVLLLSLFCSTAFAAQAQHVHSIKECCKAPISSQDCLKYCSQIKVFSEDLINDDGKLEHAGVNHRIINKINNFRSDRDSTSITLEETRSLLNNAQNKELMNAIEKMYQKEQSGNAL
jgi:hypothetical protein